MPIRRQLPCALLSLCVTVAACDQAVEPAPTPEPAVQPEPEAPTPSAEGAPCATWSHVGQPVEHIADLMDPETMAALGSAMGLTAECSPTNGPAYRELHCSLSSQEWDFMVEVFEFDEVDNAQWDHERSQPGRTTRIDGAWLLVVHADNGPCGRTMLDTLIPPGSSVKGFEPTRVAAMFAPQGWTAKEYNCDVETDEGSQPFHADHCRLQHGERWEVSTSVVQRPAQGESVEDTRGLHLGTATLTQAGGGAEVTVFDGVSADAMTRALLR
jgi:hypothetical protein